MQHAPLQVAPPQSPQIPAQSTLLDRLNDLRNYYENIGDREGVQFYDHLILDNTPPRYMHWDPKQSWDDTRRAPSLIIRPNLQMQHAPLQVAHLQSPQIPARSSASSAQNQNQAKPLNRDAPEFKMPPPQGGKSRKHSRNNKGVIKSKNKNNF